MSKTPAYKVTWNTEDASGELPVSYITLGAAISAAREWEAEMLASDTAEDTPRKYKWEVIRTHPPCPKNGHNEGDTTMSITAQIDAIIKDLTDAKEDAAKCDKGQTGAPGTRLRKTASLAAKGLKAIREDVLKSRKDNA